jgi:hypothetical protein
MYGPAVSVNPLAQNSLNRKMLRHSIISKKSNGSLGRQAVPIGYLIDSQSILMAILMRANLLPTSPRPRMLAGLSGACILLFSPGGNKNRR